MKIGVLTGGGDCPGLNPAIRAIVKKAEKLGDSVLGIKNGWAGLVNGQVEPLTDFAVSGILHKGGTILGTSRTNPSRKEDSIQKCLSHVKKYGLEAIIAIGGEDTLGAAKRMADAGLNIVGVPKTIDNDLTGTEYNIGFDTAINIVVDAIDRLHTTAESHRRVMVVEVMGRESGWIAAVAGMAGGADYIIVPEEPFDMEEICATLNRRHATGKTFSIVVVAEGARPKGGATMTTLDETVDEFGHVRLGGIGTIIAREMEQKLGVETRVTILGHIQRGGTPSAYDRYVATRLGLKAVQLVHEKKFGIMAAVHAGRIVEFPLAEVEGRMRKLDPDVIADMRTFFG
jgi:6-phosphofructokinase 1